jgi:hypothetical protein
MKTGRKSPVSDSAPRGGESRVEYRITAARRFLRDIVNFMNFAAPRTYPHLKRRAA